jgi:hypothetical protein
MGGSSHAGFVAELGRKKLEQGLDDDAKTPSRDRITKKLNRETPGLT